MAIRWKWINIRPYPGYFDLGAVVNVIHQIPVIRDKNDKAERMRYELANEFKNDNNPCNEC